MERRYFNKSLITMLICVFAALALVAVSLISAAGSHAEDIRADGELIEGLPFTITVDTKGETLKMGLPGGLNIVSAGVQRAGDGALVVNGNAVYTFTAAAGSYTLQLVGENGPAGRPLSFTVASAAPEEPAAAPAPAPEVQPVPEEPAAAPEVQPVPEEPAAAPDDQAGLEEPAAAPDDQAGPEEPAAPDELAGPEEPAAADELAGPEEDNAENIAAVAGGIRALASGDYADVTFIVNGKTDKVVTVAKGKTAAPYTPGMNTWPAAAVSFRGWYEQGMAEAFDFSTPIEDDLYLYAMFSEKYLIKYLDADNKVVSSRELYPGEGVPEFTGTIIPPAGKELAYWYEQEEGPNTPFAFGTRTADRDMVLVPCFGDRFFVGFISAGTQVDPVIVAGGMTAPQPADPTREGYEFMYWSITPTGTAFDFNTPVTQANTQNSVLTLYAVWKAAMAEYTVAYWFEKPNIQGDPGNNPGNYDFYSCEKKQALATSLVNYTSEGASGLHGVTIPFNDSDLGVIEKPVGVFHHGESQRVQGDGTTVINVYYSRITFFFYFDLNLESSSEEAMMTFKGSQWPQIGGETPVWYSFSAKYEQDIENDWPSSWNADVVMKRMAAPGEVFFNGWTTAGLLYELTTKRLSVTPDLVPRPGSYARMMEAVWVTGIDDLDVSYWVEALPKEKEEGKAKNIDKDVAVYVPADNGQDTIYEHVSGWFVRDEQLSQKWKSVSSVIAAKAIEGLTPKFANNISDDFVFELYYDRLRYSLTFNPMGGVSGAQNPGKNYDDIMYEEDLNDYRPANPTRMQNGVTYTFSGWYMDAEYLVPFDFSTAIMPHSNVELFARWEYEKKTVQFFSGVDGGNLGIDQAVELGACAIAPSGYVPGETIVGGKGVFDGWLFYLYPDEKSGLTRYNFDIPVTKDVILYANVKTTGFKVTYEKGAGSGVAPADPRMPAGYDWGTIARAMSGDGLIPPAGQAFYGWKFKGDEPVVEPRPYAFALGDTPSGIILPGNTFTVTGDMVLVAQYYPENDLTTIVFDRNGGTGTMANQIAVYGEDLTLTANAFTRSSYTFINWNTRANGSGTSYSNRQAFKPWSMRAETITLYAQWAPVSTARYTVTVNDSYAAVTGAGSYTAGSNVAVNAGVRGGYTFAGWTVNAGSITLANSASASFTMPAGDVVVTANWTQILYSVTYRPGTHGTFAAQTTNGLKYNDPTPQAPAAAGETGWNFTGWSPVPQATVTGNAIYTAQWEQKAAEKHTVRFVDWDDRLLKTQQVPHGGSATPPPDPARAGYIFDGWDRSFANVMGDMTVKALYVPDQVNILIPNDPGVPPLSGGRIAPFKEAGIPTLTLGGLEVPLWSGKLGDLAWALVNLVLCIAGALLAIMAALRASAYRKRGRLSAGNSYYSDDDEQGRQGRRLKTGWLLVAIIMAVAGVVVFIVTEDMNKVMVFVDNWTIVSAILFLIEVLSLTQLFRSKGEDPDDTPPDDLAAYETT